MQTETPLIVRVDWTAIFCISIVSECFQNGWLAEPRDTLDSLKVGNPQQPPMRSNVDLTYSN